MTTVRAGVLGLISLGALLTPTIVSAQVYRWVDQQGGVHYSEGLGNVPSEYRATAKPLAWPKSPPPPPESPKSESEKPPPEKAGEPEKPPQESGRSGRGG